MGTFLQPVSPVMGAGEGPSSVTATPSVPLGTYWGDASGNQYVYVYNAGTQQISQGQFAVPATNASGYSVTASSVTFSDLAMGVARNATLTTATYGWLMYRGFSGLSTDTNASFTTGQAVILGSNGNFQPATTVAGSFVTAAIVGKTIQTVNTGVTFVNAAFFNFM
jgi:hypothetical protein